MPTEKNHVYGGLAGRLAGGASGLAATACDRSMTGGEMAGPVPLTAPLREFCAENMTGVAPRSMRASAASSCATTWPWVAPPPRPASCARPHDWRTPTG